MEGFCKFLLDKVEIELPYLKEYNQKPLAWPIMLCYTYQNLSNGENRMKVRIEIKVCKILKLRK